MQKESEWATYGMMEVPFWRNGMTPDEYDAEREYYYRHMDEVQEGKYIPLWKQRTTDK